MRLLHVAKPQTAMSSITETPSMVPSGRICLCKMASATNMDDAKARAARILEAFEGSVVAKKRAVAEQIEHASLKEHLQSLLDNNQILRRAVAIQHERNVEQEGKEREAQHLKLMLDQYVEQARTLEMNNYTLRLHLRRAQQSSSINGQFPPDIY
ncbi:uncharacterized protein LOC120146743 isoform X1 [Hibiscus syriacus]|uniref:uncharacterized protein LOC120146743 isoform X1 n=1 Tax=Hibiscus syriacus TaxID=106335 RepID=UPI001923C0A8|nr:uncharacterized protein LOC120146743 isoform X1 [Hibiscus syriacus]XP_039016168.1 uncharacterized protein LOC120146743 isoform X1 [Hibiscus syriacus]